MRPSCITHEHLNGFIVVDCFINIQAMRRELCFHTKHSRLDDGLTFEEKNSDEKWVFVHIVIIEIEPLLRSFEQLRHLIFRFPWKNKPFQLKGTVKNHISLYDKLVSLTCNKSHLFRGCTTNFICWIMLLKASTDLCNTNMLSYEQIF